MQVTRLPPIKQSRKLKTVWIYGAWYAPYCTNRMKDGGVKKAGSNHGK